MVPILWDSNVGPKLCQCIFFVSFRYSAWPKLLHLTLPLKHKLVGEAIRETHVKCCSLSAYRI